MKRDDIINMALEAGFSKDNSGLYNTSDDMTPSLKRFAALVAAAEQEKVAQWMIRKGYATGHGDTTENLLDELEWQIAERK